VVADARKRAPCTSADGKKDVTKYFEALLARASPCGSSGATAAAGDLVYATLQQEWKVAPRQGARMRDGVHRFGCGRGASSSGAVSRTPPHV